jgi:membrane protease YdiL (CAAX protease family)
MQEPSQVQPQQLPPQLPERPPLLRRLGPVPFAVVALAVVFFLYQFVAGGITLVLFGMKVSTNEIQLFRVATLIGQLLFILLPTILLVRLRGERVVEYFRIAIPEYKEIVLTFIAVFALQQVLQGYMAMQDAIPLPAPLQRIIDELKAVFEETYRNLATAHSPGEFVFVVIVIALTPAICEEMLFRGLVQRSFEKVTVGVQGAVITGVIFAGFHLVPYSFVPLAALGIYFGFIVYRTQNITVAISAHFFNNFVACTAVYLEMNDDFVAIAPHRTPTSALIFLNTIVFVVVFLLASYYFIRVTERAEHPQE